MSTELIHRLKEEKLLRLARSNVNTFTELVMKDAQTGNAMRQASMHISWQEHIDWCWENGYHAGVLAPWGHGKSNQMISRILYEIGRNPAIRGKIISNSDTIASDRVSTIKSYIEYSSEYQKVFPGIVPNKDQWGAQRFSIRRKTPSPDPTLESHGILSTGIGARADLMIFDDVVDQRNAVSEPKKQIQIIDTFYSTWLSRLEPNGRVLYIATRWTMTDLTTQLLKSPSWCWLVQSVDKDVRYIEEVVQVGAG